MYAVSVSLLTLHSITLTGVERIKLDVTNPADVAAAATSCADVTLLINNAGIARGSPFLAANSAEATRTGPMAFSANSSPRIRALSLAPDSLRYFPAVSCEVVVADIGAGSWPFPGRQFDAVVVTNYLWRPLMPTLLASLASGGVLIYETFSQGNEIVDKPSRSDLLLRPGELLALCRNLRVVAFEVGYQDAPARFVQQIAAVRETSSAVTLPRTTVTRA